MKIFSTDGIKQRSQSGAVSHQKHQGWGFVKNADFWAVVDTILMAPRTPAPWCTHSE